MIFVNMYPTLRKMYLNSTLFLVLWLAQAVQMSSTCGMYSFGNCPDHELITTREYQGFISPENLNSQCRKMKKALDCGVSQSYLTGCEDKELLEYNMVKQLHRSICEEFQTDYIKSAKCFQSQNLKMSVGSCVTVISTYIEDPEFCYYFENFEKCIDELQDSNCDQNDTGLLNKILLSYINPLGKLYKCPGYERPETTTSTTQTPPTTTTLETATDSTTTSTTATAIQDEAETAPKTGSVVDDEKGGAVSITQNLFIKCLVTSLVGFISIYLTTKC